MDLTDDGAPKPPAAPPPPVTAQPLQVTPDNVVELGVLFSYAADRLEVEIQTIEQDLLLPRPWLEDPVSKRVRVFFNKYFVDGENSFAKIVRAAFDQHVVNAEALAKAAELYGKMDELNAALHKNQTPG